MLTATSVVLDTRAKRETDMFSRMLAGQMCDQAKIRGWTYVEREGIPPKQGTWFRCTPELDAPSMTWYVRDELIRTLTLEIQGSAKTGIAVKSAKVSAKVVLDDGRSWIKSEMADNIGYCASGECNQVIDVLIGTVSGWTWRQVMAQGVLQVATPKE